MNALKCKVCGHLAINGFAPENCPVCGAPKKSFEETPDIIKTPADPSNPTELEQKHVPLITIVKDCGLIPNECFDVHFKCGQIKHPMMTEHSIQYFDIYVENIYISRIYLTPEHCNPAAALHLKKAAGSKITAIAFCNLHGYWINESEL